MDDFRDSTKTRFISGGRCFAKGGAVIGPRGAASHAQGFSTFKKGPKPPAPKCRGGKV